MKFGFNKKIINRDSAMEEGFAGSGLHDFFAHKIHQNVHVALLMNTGHPNFVSRILSNPPLYKHCNIVDQIISLAK